MRSKASLTYTKIRETLLNIDLFSPEHRYVPKTSLGVSLGDIGFVQGDKFVKLDSLRTMFGKTCPMSDYTTASGKIESLGMYADGAIV